VSLILQPGSEPPMIVPWCRSCDMPVEKFAMDVVTSPYYVGIHASCHGVTSSMRLSVEDLFRAKRTGEKLYVITKAQGLGAPKRGSYMGHHG